MNAQLEVEISGKLDGLQTALNQAMGKIDDFVNKTKGASDKVESAFKKMERAGSAMSDIGGRLSVALTAPIVLLGKASITAYAELDSLKRGLQAVMGAGADLNGELTKLKEVAKLPGLGFKEAIEGSVRLQAAGFSADAARRTLMSFGNALATVGKGKAALDSVTYQLVQLQNKTSGFGADLRVLTEHLPQLRSALEKAFGTSVTEDIANMGYTGAQVVAMLTDEFAKLPKVTGGVSNAIENLQDSLGRSSASMGEAIDKAFNLQEKFDSLGDTVTSLTGWFTSLNPTIQKFSFIGAGLAAAIGPVSLIFGQILSMLPKLSAGFSFFATKILPITGIIYAIGNAFKALYDFFTLDWSGPANKIASSLLKIGTSVDMTGLGRFATSKITNQLENNPLLQSKSKAKPLGVPSNVMQWALGSTGEGYKVPLDYISKIENKITKITPAATEMKESLRRALAQSAIEAEHFLEKISAMELKISKIGATNYGKAFANSKFGDVQIITTQKEVSNQTGLGSSLPNIGPEKSFGLKYGAFAQMHSIAMREGQNAFAEMNEQLEASLEKLQMFSPLISTIGDQFVNLATGGVFSFKAIGDQLKQLMAKLVSAAIVASILSVASGGSLSFVGGFKKVLGLAEGGIVTKPTLAMIGEGGEKEAVIPFSKLLPMVSGIFNAGRNVPNNSMGLGNVTVVVNQDRFGNWNLNQQAETYRNRIG